MSVKKIGALLALDGEKEYRSALQKINSEMKLVNSEMKLVTAQFANNANSLQALTSKNEVLTKQYDTQKSKIQTLDNALENARKNQSKIAETVENYKEKVQQATQKLEEMKNATSSSDEEIEKQEKEVKELNSDLEKAEKAYTNAEKSVNNWEIQINNANASLVELDNDLKDNERYMNEARNSTDETAHSIDEYGNAVKDVGDNALTTGDIIKANLISEVIMNGIEGLIEGTEELAQNIIETGMEFESAFTGVTKTVTATEEELGSLRQGILDMAGEIPSTTTAIAGVEEAAGQLGIQTENIEQFSRTMIDLGETTDIESAEAAESLAQLANVTGMGQDKFDELGSTIVALGNNMATTESSIVDMGTNLASAGSQVGMTEAQIMSFAAALSSVGLEAAAGGTAFSKLMINMQVAVESGNEDLTNFASVANMTADDFKKAFREDASGAIIEFLKGLNDTERNGKSAISVLTDMGVTETRLRDTILRASNASDTFNGALELGTAAWKENNALTKEAELRYGTTESKVSILTNKISVLGIEAYDKFKNSFAAGVEDASQGVDVLTSAVSNGKLGDCIEKLGKEFEGFVAGSTRFATSALPVVIDGVSLIVDNLDLITAGFAGMLAANISNKLVSGVTALSATFTELTATTTTATVAQEGLNVAQSASPIGIIVTAVAATTAALGAYIVANANAAYVNDEFTDSLEKAIADTGNLTEEIKDLLGELKNQESSMNYTADAASELCDSLYNVSNNGNKSNAEMEKMEALVESLNEAIPDLNLELNKETGELNLQKDEVNALIDHQKKLNKEQLAQENVLQLQKNIAESNSKIEENTQARTEATEALNEEETKLNDLMSKGSYESYSIQISDCESKISSYKEKISELSEKEEENKNAVDEAQQKYNDYMSTLDGSEETINKTVVKTVELNGATYDLSETEYAAWKDIKDAYQEAYDEASKSLEGQIGLFDKMSMKSEISIGEMLKNLQSQEDSMYLWADNLKKASEMGIDEGLLAKLNDGTIESAQYLNEIVNNTSYSVDDINAKWRGVEDGKNYLSSTMAEMNTDTTAKLNSLVETTKQTASEGSVQTATNYVAGYESQEEPLRTELQKYYDTVLNNLSSPDTEGIGSAKASEFNSGIDSQSANTYISACGISSVANDGLDSADSYTTGSNFTQGFANGMSSAVTNVAVASAAIGFKALSTLSKTIEEGSPSRATYRSGKFFDEGFLNAINDNAEDAEIAAANMGEKSVSALVNSMKSASDYEFGTSMAAELTASIDDSSNYRDTVNTGTTNSIGTIIFQPQSMTEADLDRCFNYVNKKFGTSL